MSPAFEKQLLEQVARLKPAQQQRVLDFARTLSENREKGVPGSDLLRFVGPAPAIAAAFRMNLRLVHPGPGP